ncbi:hypothetical protein ACFQZJ_04590 [Maribacter chungangensis]|uniref:Lipocalin-like domain-containing protein n=1 Tax=Maribacter chungangensis TaxID=1069117 RepID=A0ABW3B071_9FLAO
MKKFQRVTTYLPFLFLTITLLSCQDEFEEVTLSEETTAITLSSVTATLMKNTATKDGSFDNIVDGASCIDIKFPYTVTVNGLDVIIDSLEDLQVIEQVFDAAQDDENILEIIFPITITQADFTEIALNGLEEFRKLAAECTEGGADEDIECIDFIYPITLFTFDVDLEQTGSIVAENDKDLRLFFSGLKEGDLASVDFPISLKLYDGTSIEVNSNEELTRTLEGARDACDEDDDDDYNDDDFDKERLNNYLTECPWFVREVKRDGRLQTEQYVGYLMNFATDGTVTVRNGDDADLNGSWGTSVSDKGILVQLNFDTLVDFNLEWLIYDIGEGKIKLYESPENRIIMHSACDIYSNSPDNLRALLIECSWIIKRVKNNGSQINRLLGYEFQFKPDGVVTLSNRETVSEGAWEITTNQEGRLVMAIVMGEEPSVSFEWLLSDLEDRRLQFNIEGTRYEIILVRDCEAQDEEDKDVGFLTTIFNETEWKIAYAEENGDDTTQMYDDVALYMDRNGSLEVRSLNGEVYSTGIWFAYRNAEFKLELIIAFSPGSNYLPLANDYVLLDIAENRLELKHQNDGGGYDKLILER